MSDQSDPARWHRVGELAAATGLTVRALHYYEEIGLLVPAQRTAAGHRIYGDADVERLYRIRLLRGLGLPLQDISTLLQSAKWALGEALRAHLRTVDREATHTARLRTRLAALVAEMDASPAPSADDLIRLLEDMNMETAIRERISILVYADIPAVHEFLVRVFGLEPGELTYDPGGRCVHGVVRAGDGTIWLHPETATYALASPRTLGAASATMAVMVDDVDDHHRHVLACGADIVYPPVDQPYGYREYSARDPEGGLWSFMKALG